MAELTVESVRREVDLYQEAVYFFAGFKKILTDAGLIVRVEMDFNLDDRKVRPDFHCTSKTLTTVLDHKGSVTSNNLGIQKMCEGVMKYWGLVEEESGDVGVAVPEDMASQVKGIIDLTASKLFVMGFELSTDDEWLQVNPFGQQPKCNFIRAVLGTRHKFDLDTFSLQKFIRHDPPVPLTASHLWLSLYQFTHKMREDQNWFLVAYDAILTVLESIYAPWIGNIPQLTRGRVNKALELLNWVEWVEFSGEGQPVKVFPNKSTRSGDILSKLIEKWVEYATKDKESVDKNQSDNGTIQTGIEDFTEKK